MVAELIATLSPVEIATDDKLMFEADVPTVKPDNTTVVPSDLYSVALVTVPVATAVPAVMAFNVNTPAEAAGANVALQVQVTTNVAPAVNNSSFALDPAKDVIWSKRLFRRVVAIDIAILLNPYDFAVNVTHDLFRTV